MLKNFFTNTKSRWNIKYLFKNNNKNKPNAITYHGGLSKRYIFNVSKSLTRFGSSFHAPTIAPR